MDQLKLLQRRLEREQLARKRAEQILEAKALELHTVNKKLTSLNESLEQEVAERTKALKLSEMRYRQIVESADDFIFRTDAKGYFTYINPVVTQKMGYTAEEVLGSHFTEYVLKGYEEKFMELYINYRDTRQLNTYQELPIVSKEGDIIWVGQNVQIIVEQDEVKEVTGVARDISERKITENALQSTQLRLTSLITNLHSGVLVEDEYRKIVLANKLFCNLLKIPANPKELKGMDCRLSAVRSKHLFKEPNKFLARVDQLIKDRKRVVGEELYMADGKILERDYIPIWGENRYMGHLWQYRDITEKYVAEEKLKQSEEKYRGIIENMQLGLLEVDNQDTIIQVYDWFCDMTGYKAEELVGKNAEEVLLPAHEKGSLAREHQKRQKGKSGVYEIQIKKKDGSLMWVLISGAPIFDQQGKVTGSIGIHYDITDRKKLQHDLEQAKLIAEEAELAEKQFLARMSHEIRTPLNAIIGMSHLLDDTSLSIEQQDYVESLKSSSDILQKLISDILDLSKITAGGLEVHHRTFDLPGSVKSLQKTFQLKLEGSPVNIVAEIDDQIQNLIIGDDLLLNQILLNLIGNAVKFTREGTIAIKVKVLEKTDIDYAIEFVISDTGIGIAKDRLTSIFENFKQADNKIRFQFGGTGLGLPIAKQLVELQGGTIEVKSEKGKGTDFIFRLRYEKSNKLITDAAKENAEVHDVVLGDCHILVAEDNFMNRKYVSALFKKWEMKYQFAVNGKEAVEKASQEKYDLIFMDISMPEMNGYDATIQIRNTLNLNQHTPIVALTASAMLNKKDKAFEVGMSDYLAKPFNPNQLKKIIRNYCSLDKTTFSEEEAEPGFEFDEQLDKAHLEYLYKKDLDYASEMFEIFLSYTMQEYQKFQALFKDKDVATIYKLAHKIKPNFSLVGLTGIEAMMLELEKLAEQKTDMEALQAKFEAIDEAVKANQPLIEATLKNMQKQKQNDTKLYNH